MRHPKVSRRRTSSPRRAHGPMCLAGWFPRSFFLSFIRAMEEDLGPSGRHCPARVGLSGWSIPRSPANGCCRERQLAEPLFTYIVGYPLTGTLVLQSGFALGDSKLNAKVGVLPKAKWKGKLDWSQCMSQRALVGTSRGTMYSQT